MSRKISRWTLLTTLQLVTITGTATAEEFIYRKAMKKVLEKFNILF